MPTWPDDPPWRQGHVVPHETATRLGLVTTANEFAVVISHDCDLAQSVEVEPHIEVIAASRIGVPDGNHTHTKNARRIHLPYLIDKNLAYADLSATKKTTLPKQELAEVEPARNFVLAPAGLEELQRWLAARYRRAAFPNGFEARMKSRDLNRRIAKLAQQHAMHVLGIYFDVDNGADSDRTGEDDTYELRIAIVYSTTSDPDRAREEAKRLSTEITQLFKRRCEIDGQWKDIELVGCQHIADSDASLARVRALREWRLEYLSLAAEPHGDTVDI